MEYNTQRRKLPLPQYGRSVQNMVDYCLTIEDRKERQHCANTIIDIMGNMFPRLRDSEDFKHKLWDHLAIMSDFQLDIDYPYDIVRKDELHVKPDQIPYQQERIRYRYYGHLVEMMIQRAVAYPDGEEKMQLINLIANYMKRSYVNWNKENVEDQKIVDDLREYSNGAINLSIEDLYLAETKVVSSKKQNNIQRKQSNQRKQNNQYRKSNF
ncbi:MAG: DUF4290 domain-containing protein [Phocaeicola sp.]|uniref:DUF4290 domain-containing protein n=1 Tax=Phocaeicola TaxID=909656 RepID=UPI00234F973D|nr:DUF4290 domain-containing protein [Phocaeicola oris]MCE2615962.1 DUF4290 domain-containing protein [Phocaeicola oris]